MIHIENEPSSIVYLMENTEKKNLQNVRDLVRMYSINEQENQTATA